MASKRAAMSSERGQDTVEWAGVLVVVALVVLAIFVTGVPQAVARGVSCAVHRALGESASCPAAPAGPPPSSGAPWSSPNPVTRATWGTYVSLGDSYSAGEGLGNYQPGSSVHQSQCRVSVFGACVYHKRSGRRRRRRMHQRLRRVRRLRDRPQRPVCAGTQLAHQRLDRTRDQPRRLPSHCPWSADPRPADRPGDPEPPARERPTGARGARATRHLMVVAATACTARAAGRESRSSSRTSCRAWPSLRARRGCPGARRRRCCPIRARRPR